MTSLNQQIAQKEKELAELKELAKKQNTIKFESLGLEIMREDLCEDATMKEALKQMPKGRRIPTDQEIEAMVYSMEGEYLQDKIIKFVELTGIDGRYRTSTEWSSSTFVLRKFGKLDRDRYRFSDYGSHHVRPVRSL